MAFQAQLLPSLFALLPASQLDLILSRISLHALHVEPYHIRDDIYVATHPVIPGQQRALRMRARRRRRPLPKPKATTDVGAGVTASTSMGAGAGPTPLDGWDYTLAWVSPPLSGREHQEMRVQAYVGLEVAGMSGREEIEDFVQSLGFKRSHTYSRLGHLFHLPIPGQLPLTLHLTVTRVLGADEKPASASSQASTEPYLVQLQPARPVGAVAGRAELSLQDTMKVMHEVAGRIDGLEWETGR